MTPLFGVMKGKCEAALIDLPKQYPSLRPYSVRPAFVDAAFDPQVLKHVLQRPDQRTLGKTLLRRVGGPPFRAFFANSVSPTKELGGYLTKLASGDGKPLSGEGISGDGWIVSNIAFRREAGI